MDDDGIYVRSKDGDSIGPLTEREFQKMCRSASGGDIASAYRLAGGHPYPIQLSARVRFDAKHAFSCAACNHCCELCVIIFCGVCTIAVFALVRNSKEMKKEREQVCAHHGNVRAGATNVVGRIRAIVAQSQTCASCPRRSRADQYSLC